jgi:hypothetical protein
MVVDRRVHEKEILKNLRGASAIFMKSRRLKYYRQSDPEGHMVKVRVFHKKTFQKETRAEVKKLSKLKVTKGVGPRSQSWSSWRRSLVRGLVIANWCCQKNQRERSRVI